MKPRTRDDYLRDIADNVRALSNGMQTVTHVERAPGLGEDGIRRRAAEAQTWRLQHTSLLHQLTAALLPRQGAGEPTSGGKPASRPPSATAASNTLDVIRLEAGDLRERMRVEARGRRTTGRHTITGDLYAIRAHALGLSEEWARAAATATTRWVSLARATLALDAPVATLRDVPCPHCGTLLKVRSDASSDVWCPNPGCRDIDGNRHTWARAEWPFLLEQLGRRDGAA